MVTFNVVYTPGTARRLVPFGLSLLQGSGVSLRLVANGCDATDVELLGRVASEHERVSRHVLPWRRPVEHGIALNHLFEAFPDESHFAIADSDVIASGDFMQDLWPLAAGQAAVCAAPPVWAARAEMVAPPGWPVLSGRLRELPDGTAVGGTYFAIYDRAALQPQWRRAPRGFRVHHTRLLPAHLRATLTEHGWCYRMLDTGRLIHLLLIADGHSVENRDSPQLHHVGAFSGVAISGRGALVGRAWTALRAADWRQLRQFADDMVVRAHLRRPHAAEPIQRLNERRRKVIAHLRAVVEACAEGRPPPAAAAPTGCDEVDRGVAALTEALRTQYDPRLAQ